MDRPTCDHVWIDVADPKRAPVVPIIGTGPDMMQRGHSYTCTVCGAKFTAPAK